MCMCIKLTLLQTENSLLMKKKTAWSVNPQTPCGVTWGDGKQKHSSDSGMR